VLAGSPAGNHSGFGLGPAPGARSNAEKDLEIPSSFFASSDRSVIKSSRRAPASACRREVVNGDRISRDRARISISQHSSLACRLLIHILWRIWSVSSTTEKPFYLRGCQTIMCQRSPQDLHRTGYRRRSRNGQSRIRSLDLRIFPDPHLSQRSSMKRDTGARGGLRLTSVIMTCNSCRSALMLNPGTSVMSDMNSNGTPQSWHSIVITAARNCCP